jgi:hypothetical protein
MNPSIIALILAIGSAPVLAQNSCLTEALQNYTRLKVAALEGATSLSVLSPETLVGLRRMEEIYCYRAAYCLVGNPKENQSIQVPYASVFAKCLQDEALEKYDAVPRAGK